MKIMSILHGVHTKMKLDDWVLNQELQSNSLESVYMSASG